MKKLRLLALVPLLLSTPARAAERTPDLIPEITIIGHASDLREDVAADDTGRPDWTSRRRFTTTRV